MNRVGLEINEDLIKMVNEVEKIKAVLDDVVMKKVNRIAEKIDLRVDLSMQLVIAVDECNGEESVDTHLVYPKVTIYNNLNEVVGMLQIDSISIDKLLCKVKNINVMDLNKYYSNTLNDMLVSDNIIYNPSSIDERNLVGIMCDEIFALQVILDRELKYIQGIDFEGERYSVFDKQLENRVSSKEYIEQFDSIPKTVEPIDYYNDDTIYEQFKETLDKYGLGNISLDYDEEKERQELKEVLKKYELDIQLPRE